MSDKLPVTIEWHQTNITKKTPMSLQERQKITKELFDWCLEVLERKGKDYLNGESANSQFKNLSEQLGISVTQVWAVLFSKHITAIMNYVKNGQTESEPIESRILDAINYLAILNAIIKED